MTKEDEEIAIDTIVMARDDFLISPEQCIKLIKYFKSHYKFLEEQEKRKRKLK